MELWIRSQDKECLMKVNRLDIDYSIGTYKIKEGGFATLLAEYKSERRALEVLDEIQNILFQKKSIIKANSLYRYEDLKQIKKDIEKLNGDSFITMPANFDFIPLGNAVFYQMPKE